MRACRAVYGSAGVDVVQVYGEQESAMLRSIDLGAFTAQVIRLPFRAPRASAYSKRWVRTVRQEVLDQMLILGRRDLESALVEFIDHYKQARPHQGIEQRRPCGPANVVPLPTGPVERRDRLGGIIHEYSRAA